MVGNLHIHTEYSLLEAYVRIDDLIQQAKEYQYRALAITDTNNIYGVIRFYQRAKEQGIKPVIGSMFTHKDYYVILLAMNNQGYYEINYLITYKNIAQEDFCLITYIKKHIKNCFILTPHIDMAEAFKEDLADLIYVELPLTYHYFDRQLLIQYCKNNGLSFVPTYPVYFLKKEDHPIYQLLTAIRKNKTMQSVESECMTKRMNYLIPKKTFKKYLSEYPASCKRIAEIVDQCCVEFEFDKIHLPEIFFKGKKNAYRQLCSLCIRELNHRGRFDLEYINRLKKELSIIKQMNLESYFLIVYKIVNYARQNNISYTGRGSAANSLVCYLLKITFIDPIKFNLFFERFLHIKRKGLPDVDIDFPWNRRDDVINFIYDTFKTTHTALICTHITFNVRSAVRESAKVLGIDDREISRITKKIPFFFRLNDLSELSDLPEFSRINFKGSLWERVFFLAGKIIHLPRHISIHPGGMVISRKPLFYFTSLEKAPKGFFVTQLNMYDIEKLGLLKMDILGQRSLAVIDMAKKYLKHNHIPEIEDIFHDKNTISSIRSGETIGCFYIESPAMRQLLKKLRVSTFEELTAASSVIRPGVAESGMMHKYIQYHNKPSEVVYMHKDLKRVLAETYGIMIYQEDVIRITAVSAGFKPEEGDILRRSMSGKERSPEKMRVLKQRFISGCTKNNYTEKTSVKLWDQIASFAGYAFCKAHSASYARISFIVAYIKRYFPAVFMASVLSNRGGFYAPLIYVEEARQLSLQIYPPDVRYAEYDFVPVKAEGIMTGLSFIKNISYKTIERIINERKTGQYKSLSDFIIRCNITSLEFQMLAKCGALDWTGYNRKQLLLLSQKIEKLRKQNKSSSLFDLSLYFPFPVDDFTLKEKILMELELFGFSSTANPLKLICPKYSIIKSCEMEHYKDCDVMMLGIKIFSKRIPAKKKNKGVMKFISFMDLYGTFETFLSTKNYQRLACVSVSSHIFYVYGRISEEFGTYTLYLKNMEPVFLK